MIQHLFNKRLHRTLSINFVVILFLCTVMFLGIEALTKSASSQEKIPEIKETIKATKKDEESLIKILIDDKLKTSSPEVVLGAIQEAENLVRVKSKCSYELVTALASLLDFRKKPLSSIEGPNPVNSDVISEPRLISVDENYPAIVALEYVGKPALPILIKVIENEESNSLKSQNALTVIKFNFREDFLKAANYLKQSAALAETQEAQKRLLTAADKISKSSQKIN